jgi:hypothetical protein
MLLDHERANQLRAGRRLEHFTLGWNLIEAAVAVSAGFICWQHCVDRIWNRLSHRKFVRRNSAVALAGTAIVLNALQMVGDPDSSGVAVIRALSGQYSMLTWPADTEPLPVMRNVVNDEPSS